MVLELSGADGAKLAVRLEGHEHLASCTYTSRRVSSTFWNASAKSRFFFTSAPLDSQKTSATSRAP